MAYDYIFTFKLYYKGMTHIKTRLLTDSGFRWCDNAKTNNCLISQTVCMSSSMTLIKSLICKIHITPLKGENKIIHTR